MTKKKSAVEAPINGTTITGCTFQQDNRISDESAKAITALAQASEAHGRAIERLAEAFLVVPAPAIHMSHDFERAKEAQN